MSKDKAALLNGVRTGMLSLFVFAVSVMHKLTDRTVAATHDIMNFPMLIFLLQRFEIHAEESVFHFYQSASGLFSVMSVYGNPEIGIEYPGGIIAVHYYDFQIPAFRFRRVDGAVVISIADQYAE